MSKQIQYTDEPLGELKLVPDFLPSPEEMVLKDENVKVTVALRDSFAIWKRPDSQYF